MSKFIYKTSILILFFGASNQTLVAQSPKDTAIWHNIFNELVANQALSNKIWTDTILQQHLYKAMMFLHDTSQTSIAGSYYSLANVENLALVTTNYIAKYYPKQLEATKIHIEQYLDSLHSINTTISKKIQTIDLEDCILISNNQAFLYWASHYELLADSISNTTFDTTAIRKKLDNYAAERIFTDKTYPFNSQLSDYLQNKNVLYIPDVVLLETSYIQFYDTFSNQLADGFRQLPEATLEIWKWMLGGLIVGIFVSIIYHQYFWKKPSKNTKDL